MKKIENKIIDHKGDKKLEEIEKNFTKELEELQEEYEERKQEIIDGVSDQSRLDKLKFWKDTKTEDVEDPRYWALVNIESMKEFVKYGANKVLDQIRVRTAANIKAREEIAKIEDKAKPGLDMKTVAFSFVIIAIVGAIAFVIISNFFNYQDVANDNVVLWKEKGRVSGELEACRAELAHYNPSALPAPKPPEAGENVLEG